MILSSLIKLYRFIFLAFILFFTISCNDNISESEYFNEDDIKEVVFRDLFINNGAGYFRIWDGINTKVKVYFIGFYSEFNSTLTGLGPKVDPPNSLIARFDNFYVPVKKVSDSNTLFFPSEGVKDKKTNELGVIFYSSSFSRIISKNEVEIEAGWEYFATNASCYTYRLYKENNRWHISYKILRWVS